MGKRVAAFILMVIPGILMLGVGAIISSHMISMKTLGSTELHGVETEGIFRVLKIIDNLSLLAILGAVGGYLVVVGFEITFAKQFYKRATGWFNLDLLKSLLVGIVASIIGGFILSIFQN